MAYNGHETSPDLVEEINILLVGESGVGKTTFINSCFNYLKYNTLRDVMENGLQVLIRSRIRIEDMYRNQKVIDLEVNYNPSEFDDVANEVFKDGKAGTQNVRTYVFSIFIGNKKYIIRFLDTPGMGDERGFERDKTNCDLILGYMSQLKKIHGFCIFLKPTNSRVDVLMNYCILQILSRLDSSAAKNVAFIFTNTRGSNFSSGHTYTPLKVLLASIKKTRGISIPLSHENMFCFDNEAFGYVAAVQNGVELLPFIFGATESSWNHSSNEFWRLLFYISHLKPHDLKKIISINEARTMASNLAGPITEIVPVILENITSLKQQSLELSDARLTQEELKAKMHMRHTEITIENLDSPCTVCTDRNCVSVYEVNGVRKTCYKRKCCSECLVTFVTPEIVGNLALYLCSAFNWDTYCKSCDHPLSVHKHIYYETRVFEKKIDESMIPEVNSQEELIKRKEDLVKTLDTRQHEFENEKQFIMRSCGIFDQYLKKNSITSIGNPIEEYLKYQITRESVICQDDKTINNLRTLLADYEREKESFAASPDFTPDQIEDIKQTLLHLKHFGPKIQKMYDQHQAGIKEAFKKKEKVVKGGAAGFFKKFQDIFNLVSSVAQMGNMVPYVKKF